MAIRTGRRTMLDDVDAARHDLSRGADAPTVDGRVLGDDLPQRPVPLAELRSLLLQPTTSFATRDRAVCWVAARARDGAEPWALGFIWLLLPGLLRMPSRLTIA